MAKVKINKNKAKLKISKENFSVDIVKLMLQHDLKNTSIDLDFIELPNFESEKLSFAEASFLETNGADIDKYKAFVMMKEEYLLDEIPDGFPNRTKPVLTLQTVTKLRPKIAVGGEPIFDENGSQVVVNDEPQIYEAGQILKEWVEDHYIGYKVNEDKINYMINSITSEEKLFTDLTQPEIASKQWSPIKENKVRMVEREVVEEYTEDLMLPDVNGAVEPKTWSDADNIYYENQGNNDDCLVLVNNVPVSWLKSVDSLSKYNVMSLFDGKAILDVWNPEI